MDISLLLQRISVDLSLIKIKKRNKGGLHDDLGIPRDQGIPTELLDSILSAKIGDVVSGAKVTAKLKSRARFAKNARGWDH